MSRERCGETLASRHGTVSTLMSSQQLWLPAYDLHKIRPPRRSGNAAAGSTKWNRDYRGKKTESIGKSEQGQSRCVGGVGGHWWTESNTLVYPKLLRNK